MIALAAGDWLLPRMTATDDDGRFEFASLGAGNYALAASRPGYVPTFYGAKKPGRGPGVQIAVIEGQSLPPVVIRLPRGGVVTGVVRGVGGLPVPGTNVMVMQVQAGGARRPLPSLEGATTDDRGVYRMFGLAPGDYVVLVQPERYRSGAWRAAPGDGRRAPVGRIRRSPRVPVQRARHPRRRLPRPSLPGR